MTKTIVHVVGTGTIGEPLIGLLLAHQDEFGIDEVTFHKRTPLLTDRSKVFDLLKKGAKLAVDNDRWDSFKELDMEPSYKAEEALAQATAVIDCTPIGNRMKDEQYKNYTDKVKGFIAQGSEFGFGKMYARGINDHALIPGEDQFVQVVSCNTHNLAVLVETIAQISTKKENLVNANFVCLRRSNDISQDESFLPAPNIGAHSNKKFGTHHARDLSHLYKTVGFDLDNVFSSAIKLPTQYMHTIHFSIEVREGLVEEELLDRIQKNPRLSVTHKTSANAVFSFGRDHGHFGRILNQTVFCLPSFHISEDGKKMTGFCFTPQDGNSLLSSVAAALWFIDPETYHDKLQALSQFFFSEI